MSIIKLIPNNKAIEKGYRTKEDFEKALEYIKPVYIDESGCCYYSHAIDMWINTADFFSNIVCGKIYDPVEYGYAACKPYVIDYLKKYRNQSGMYVVTMYLLPKNYDKLCECGNFIDRCGNTQRCYNEEKDKNVFFDFEEYFVAFDVYKVELSCSKDIINI